jgi:polygalacturonase
MTQSIVSRVFLVVMLATCSLRAANFDVHHFGAIGDGVSAETASIQKAIDECSRLGGGTVTFPSGRYVTGTIFLKDSVKLHLDEGSEILGSTNIADYRAVELFTEGTGQKMGWCLIGALQAKNIGIEGPGIIDGRGRELNAARPPSEKGKRPVLLRFVRCDGISLADLRLQASAMWMVHFSQSHRIRADRVSIYNHVAGNNDGFDIDSCDDVQITHCDVDSGDDALCLKSTFSTPSREIIVSHCKLKSDCAGIKMGTESLGGFENITLKDIQVLGARFGGLNIFSVDGGPVRNISVSDIAMERVGTAICLRLGARLHTFHDGDQAKPVGTMRNITIKNVSAKFSELTGIMINGIPGHRIEDVTLENIRIGVAGGGKAAEADIVPPENESAYPDCVMFGKMLPAYGLFSRHVKGLKLINCRIDPVKPDARPLRFVQDVEDLQAW